MKRPGAPALLEALSRRAALSGALGVVVLASCSVGPSTTGVDAGATSAAATGSGGGGGAGGATGGAAPGVCADMSELDHGDCATEIGWAWDGAKCKPFSGCGCAPNCESFFPDAVSCATACAAEGRCDLAAMKSAYLAKDPFEPGDHCDGVYVCTLPAAHPDVVALFPSIFCQTQGGPCQTSKNCAAYNSGTVTDAQWQKLCAASLLPQIDEIYCAVYGP